LNYGTRGDVADTIMHAKFCVNRFKRFAVVTFPFSIARPLQQ